MTEWVPMRGTGRADSKGSLGESRWPASVRGVLLAASILSLAACAQHQPVRPGDHADASHVRNQPFDMPTATFPEPLRGLWAVSPQVCQGALEGEGWIRISADRLTGYESSQRPLEVSRLDGGRWRIRSEENYLGTQFAEITQTLARHRDALTVEEGETIMDRYVRCGE